MSRFVLLLSLFLSPYMLRSQNPIQAILGSEARPLREDIRIDFKDEQGNESYLPISILKGTTNGPVFTIVAGVHGVEYPPIIAMQELLGKIDEKELKGTLIIIPIANVSSFFTRTPYENPQDGVNLNRTFPGDVSGTLTQQIAHFITESIIPATDIFLDIHGGDAPEDLLPFVCYYRNDKKPDQTALAARLSETSGFEYVVSYAYTITDEEPAKYAFKQAVQSGKTGLSIECGKLGNVQPEAVNLIKIGVRNMLNEMGMYPYTFEHKSTITHLNDQTYIKASRQGIFYSTYEAGDELQVGDKIGYITDVFGEVIAEYVAPVSGTILYKIGTPPVNVDDTLVCIGSSK